METRHVEIQRFARKAAGYRAAIGAAPHARALECAVVGAALRGFCKQQRRSPANVVVVDLMAGNGYLSEYLTSLGFGKVHAVEACMEMTPGVEDPGDVLKRHSIESMDHLPPLLDRIQPDVIVSIAGFHHLIHHEGRTINRLRSILWQERVIAECLARLPENGMMLIADIVDPDAACDLATAIRYWDKSVFAENHWLPESLRTALAGAGNLADYNAIVQRELPGLRENGSVSWFREVVDRETAVGHDDVAISRELLELLARDNSVGWGRFFCPWLFDDVETMLYYFLHKFGYDVDGRLSKVDTAKLNAKIRRVLSTNTLPNGQVAVGWDLGLLLVSGRGDREVRRYVRTGNLALVGMTVALTSRLVFGHAGFGAIRETLPYVDGVFFMFLGVFVTTMLSWWNRIR